MARKIKVDFTGVESFIRADEGQHVAKLVEIEEKVSSGGNDMLAAKFEVTKGNSQGAIVYENFVLSEKGLFKLKGFLEAVSKKADAKVQIDLDNLIGLTCIIDVAHEEYNGNMKAKINAYKKLTSILSKAEEAEEVEEEEFEEEEAAPPPPPKAKKAEPAPVAKKAEAKPAAKKTVAPPPVDDDDDWDED